MDNFDFDFTAFRKNLKWLMESRGMNSKELAIACNMSPGTMSRYMTGKRSPDLDYLIRISSHFDVSLDWLLGINGDRIDVLPKETYDIAMQYSLATPDDRRVVQAVLSKYRSIDNAK